LPTFAKLYPERFHNKTNGVTPRRWLAQANPGLSSLLDARSVGKDWRLNLDRLQELRPSADDAGFRSRFRAAKRSNKVRLAELHRRETGINLIRTACSTCRSSASTNTSGSCSTCCTSSPATTPSCTARRDDYAAAQRDLRRQGRLLVPHGQADHPPDQRRANVVNNDPRTQDR
jgi:hypothetical protein